jgi:hypothetical protein
MEVKGSEAQGRHRKVGSEGSVEQRYGPMYKNRIRGLRRRTSWQLTTKSVSIKDAGGKSGGSRIESGRAYRGRSAASRGFTTEGEVIHSDPAAEVSSGRSTHVSEEGPNRKQGQSNVGLTGGTAPANQPRLSFAGSEDGEAETETCRVAKPLWRTTYRTSGPSGLNLTEPPGADPHAGWCGRGEWVTTPPMPILGPARYRKKRERT